VLNMLQRFGGVVAVAVASAVFVSNGHLGTAVSFDNGFRPASLVPAGMSVLGSVSAIFARRPRAKAVDLTGAGGQQEETTVGVDLQYRRRSRPASGNGLGARAHS